MEYKNTVSEHVDSMLMKISSITSLSSIYKVIIAICLASSVSGSWLFGRSNSTASNVTTVSDDSEISTTSRESLESNGMVGVSEQDMELSLSGHFEFYEYLSELLKKKNGLLRFSDREQFNKFAKLLVKQKETFETHYSNLQSKINKANEEVQAWKGQLTELKKRKLFKFFSEDSPEKLAAIKKLEDKIAANEAYAEENRRELAMINERIKLLRDFVIKCKVPLNGDVEDKCVRFDSSWFNFLYPK